MKILKKVLFTTILFSCHWGLVNAQGNETPWYEVEIIIFSNNDSSAINSEKWPDKPEIHDYGTMIELVPILEGAGRENVKLFTDLDPESRAMGTVGVMPVPYQIIKPEKYQLKKEDNRIERSSRYDKLLHVAWRQPVFDPNDDAAVFLYDGVEEPADTIYPQEESIPQLESQGGVQRAPGEPLRRFPGQGNTPTTSADLAGAQIYDVGPLDKRIFGTIKLSLSRYLHVALDFSYRKLVMLREERPKPTMEETTSGMFETESNQFSNGESSEQPEMVQQERLTLKDFHLAQSRRVRLNELNYFDNPMFGILLRVSRYELPKEAEPENPPASGKSVR